VLVWETLASWKERILARLYEHEMRAPSDDWSVRGPVRTGSARIMPLWWACPPSRGDADSRFLSPKARRVHRRCIARSKFPKSIRRTDREIPVQVLAKSRRTGATAGGVRTEASERIFLVTASGPAVVQPLRVESYRAVLLLGDWYAFSVPNCNRIPVRAMPAIRRYPLASAPRAPHGREFERWCGSDE
jgi:hypothetical protein